jgi:uncharacterized protein YciI
VNYLLDAIECNDHALQAAMALVRNDDGPTGKMNDFEKTSSFLLPNCPVSKKRNQNGTKRTFGATVSEIDAKTIRTGVGKSTGVALRFHTQKEYAALSREEKNELREHRDYLQNQGKSRKLSTSGASKKPKGGSGTSISAASIEKMVSSALSKSLKEHAKAETDGADAEKQMKEYILSVVNTSGTGKGKAGAAQVSSAATTPSSVIGPAIIQSILRKAGEKSSGNNTKVTE